LFFLSLPRNSPLGGHAGSSSGEWGRHGLGGAQWTFLGFLRPFYLVKEIKTLKDKELVVAEMVFQGLFEEMVLGGLLPQ
jgi:hypothetical protein